MSAVDRVSTIASERGRAVKLNISRDKLMLSVNNPEGGSATEEIGVDYELPRRWRSASMRAICSTSPASSRATTAQFQLADPGSPTMVRDGGDEGALYVLMPMRV